MKTYQLVMDMVSDRDGETDKIEFPFASENDRKAVEDALTHLKTFRPDLEGGTYFRIVRLRVSVLWLGKLEPGSRMILTETGVLLYDTDDLDCSLEVGIEPSLSGR